MDPRGPVRGTGAGAGGGLWARQESNLRPKDYESPALTTELRAHRTDRPAEILLEWRSGGGTRTHNKRLNRPLLCRLSYPGIRLAP